MMNPDAAPVLASEAFLQMSQTKGIPQLSMQDFVLESWIADGGYGSVYKFRNIHTGNPVAMKFFGYAGVVGNPRQKMIEQEILTDQKMNGMKCTSKLLGYIPDSYYGYVKDVKRFNPKRNPQFPHDIKGKKHNGKFLIKVSEYFEGDDLMNTLLKGVEFDEKTAAIVFKNMVTCVKELQQANILHRDIKCENFMFKNKIEVADDTLCSNLSSTPPSTSSSLSSTPPFSSVCKYELSLIDMGVAKTLEPENQSYIDCTDLFYRKHNLLYHAPEVSKMSKYSKESDVFSLGVCLWVSIFRAFPKPSDIQGIDIKFPPNCTCSDDLKDLFHLVLESDPSKRLDIDGVLDHDFIRKRCVDTIDSFHAKTLSICTPTNCSVNNVTDTTPSNVLISDTSPPKQNLFMCISNC